MNNKILFKVMTTAALLSTLAFPVSAATELNDINGSYAKDAINELLQAGIINGKGDGKFDPTGKISRQDLAIILAKSLNLETQSAPATATFTDVPATHYSYQFVEAAAKAGLIKGQGDGKFGTGQNLSRQDMAVLFVRALGVDAAGKGTDLKFSDAGQIADYAKDAVAAALELGLISGNTNGTFNPAGNAERQAVALVASKFIKKAEELKNEASPPAENPDKESGTTQPQTPATTTPPANPGSTGSSSSSGGGTTNPGTDPDYSELAAPSLAFSDSKTLAFTYSETLDTTHVPTTDDIRITSKDGDQSFPLSIRSIAIEGKSVFVKLERTQALDTEVEASYQPLDSGRAIRSASGKLSPVFSNKQVVYRTDDPLALLSKVIDEAQGLLSSAEGNSGNTTGKYSPFAVESLSGAVITAVEVQHDTLATKERIKEAIHSLNQALDEFKGSMIQPLEISQVAGEFLLKPGTATKIVPAEGNNTYTKQSLKNLIRVQRNGEDQLFTTVNNSEAVSLGLVTNGEVIGSIEVRSSDEQWVTVNNLGSEGLSVSANASATEQSGADLIFTVREAGTIAKEVIIPVRFDAQKPTVTSATYDSGVMTVTLDEPLYNIGYEAPLPGSIRVNYLLTGDPAHPIPLDLTDFTIAHRNGEDTIVIALTDEGMMKFPPFPLPVPVPAFQIVFNQMGDFVGNKPEPVNIPIPFSNPVPLPPYEQD
ncbi:S-layer family protein [Fontibacillus phaseoli]|uniref:S-layer family protein n=1 Tax=Fontibacillus phaseoli TaxID=1416533 RepID=A0A369BDN7_9BACL|nr:S-layer homology domain-containing protein [Fontibacillus phaseoli]RCX17784.1 S-layer family protein [Fontibacillus phaseoli]